MILKERSKMNYFRSLQKVLDHPLNRHQQTRTIFRIFWWKLNQWFFHLPAKVAISSKSSLLCYPETAFGSYVVYAQLPEYPETLFVQKYLTKKSVFFDVGAHLGEYAILAAEIANKGRIFAFEPTPQSRAYLLENIALNSHAKHVEVSEYALSSKQGVAHFVLEGEAEVNHLSSEPSASKKTIKVRTTTIDAFRKKYQIKKIDLIKIDVEGGEEAVLKGSKNTLATHAMPAIIFELNPNSTWYQKSPNPVFALLAKNNYSFFSFTPQGKLKPFNNNVKQEYTINIIAVQKSKLGRKLTQFIVKP